MGRYVPRSIQIMSSNLKLNYVEFPSRDIPATKLFFENAFNWSFQDYGPDYSSFSDQGLDGGFYKSDLISTASNGSALLVLLSENLEKSLANVELAGGEITKAIFSFPGGSRFHFLEPGGNELAVWSKIST
jgi:predicted enzyme related to lactoylglutathione lyase